MRSILFLVIDSNCRYRLQYLLSDPVGPNYETDVPARTQGGKVTEVLDAGLQREHVSPNRGHYRKVSRIDLQYLANPIPVDLTVGVCKDDLISRCQGR